MEALYELTILLLGYTLKFKKQSAKQYIYSIILSESKERELRKTYLDLLISATRNSERINLKTTKLVYLQGMLRNEAVIMYLSESFDFWMYFNFIGIQKYIIERREPNLNPKQINPSAVQMNNTTIDKRGVKITEPNQTKPKT